MSISKFILFFSIFVNVLCYRPLPHPEEFYDNGPNFGKIGVNDFEKKNQQKKNKKKHINVFYSLKRF